MSWKSVTIIYLCHLIITSQNKHSSIFFEKTMHGIAEMNYLHVVNSISNFTVLVVAQAYPNQKMMFLHHVAMTMGKRISELHTFNCNNMRGAFSNAKLSSIDANKKIATRNLLRDFIIKDQFCMEFSSPKY